MSIWEKRHREWEEYYRRTVRPHIEEKAEREGRSTEWVEQTLNSEVERVSKPQSW